MKKKIAVVTATRAEYYLLKSLLNEIVRNNNFELILIVTGTHLNESFGNTQTIIEEDRFKINYRIPLNLITGTRREIIENLGVITIEAADILSKEYPDLMIILGDRYEMLGFSQAALISNIPIAHLHGGELTLGAYDDAIRHSISKMSTWHFVSAEIHRQRVIQLGEDPKRVFNVGALGVENIIKTKINTKKTQLDNPYFLVTYHPETNIEDDNLDQLLEALSIFTSYKIIITGANSDNRGKKLNEELKKFSIENKNVDFIMNIGDRYLEVLQNAEVVIGNSSSGIIEAPYLNTPTVNCGDRQKGRLFPNSVYHCDMKKVSIIKAINSALSHSIPYEYMYGEGKTSKKIIKLLSSIDDYRVQKGFNDL